MLQSNVAYDLYNPSAQTAVSLNYTSQSLRSCAFFVRVAAVKTRGVRRVQERVDYAGAALPLNARGARRQSECARLA